MPSPPRLFLASTSPWRQALLREVGVPVKCVDSGVDEEAILGSEPADTARLRARAKAEAAWRRLGREAEGCVVIGADQVAHLDGRAMGKPADAAAHLDQLQALAGRTHLLSTGVALADASGVEDFVVHTRVRFRSDLDRSELEAYVATGEASGCAGGYMAERRGAWLIEAVDGDWQNVIGLPVFDLIGRLRTRGWRMGAAGEGRLHGG